MLRATTVQTPKVCQRAEQEGYQPFCAEGLCVDLLRPTIACDWVTHPCPHTGHPSGRTSHWVHPIADRFGVFGAVLFFFCCFFSVVYMNKDTGLYLGGHGAVPGCQKTTVVCGLLLVVCTWCTPFFV